MATEEALLTFRQRLDDFQSRQRSNGLRVSSGRLRDSGGLRCAGPRRLRVSKG